jgi:hypothetical protein
MLKTKKSLGNIWSIQKFFVPLQCQIKNQLVKWNRQEKSM